MEKQEWRFRKAERTQPTVIWDARSKKAIAYLPVRDNQKDFVTTSKKVADLLFERGYHGRKVEKKSPKKTEPVEVLEK